MVAALRAAASAVVCHVNAATAGTTAAHEPNAGVRISQQHDARRTCYRFRARSALRCACRSLRRFSAISAFSSAATAECPARSASSAARLRSHARSLLTFVGLMRAAAVQNGALNGAAWHVQPSAAGKIRRKLGNQRVQEVLECLHLLETPSFGCPAGTMPWYFSSARLALRSRPPASRSKA